MTELNGIKLKCGIFEHMSEEITVAHDYITSDGKLVSDINGDVHCAPIHMTFKEFMDCFFNKLGRFKWPALANLYSKTPLNIPNEIIKAYYNSGTDNVRDITTLAEFDQIELNKEFLFMQKKFVCTVTTYGKALTQSEFLYIIKSKTMNHDDKVYIRMAICIRSAILNTTSKCILHFKLSHIPCHISSVNMANAVITVNGEDDAILPFTKVRYSCEGQCVNCPSDGFEEDGYDSDSVDNIV